MRIKFTCPDCQGTRLVQIEKNVIMRHTVAVIDKTDGIVAVDFEHMVTPDITEGECNGYECGSCGECIALTEERLLAWLEENDMVEKDD